MPRPLSFRLLSLALAWLVLATSVGLTSERHRCRVSGRSIVVLSLPGLAGRADAPGSRPDKLPKVPTRPCGKRQSGCCDISHGHLKLQAQSAAAGPNIGLPAPPVALPPALLPDSMRWVGLATATYAPLLGGWHGAAGSLPPGPPRAGRVLLAFEGKLVV